MKWENPPEPRRGRYTPPVPSWIEELKANPGRWANVERYRERWQANNDAVKVRSGKYGLGFEATFRQVDNGLFILYARYVGYTSEEEK